MPLPTFDPEDSSEDQQSKKMNVDYTEQTEATLQSASTALDQGGINKLKEVLEPVLALEKTVRLAEDYENLSKILVQIIAFCAKVQAWDELNDQLNSLSKKRAQSRGGTQKMIQEAMKYIDSTPSLERKIELINNIRKITEGKIFVELEGARVIRMLAKIREEEGNIAEAASLLQDVQVETIGSMEIREKIEFILESIRLCIEKQDFVRAVIVSKKITKKSISEESHQDLKIRFHELMIRFYNNKKQYLDIFRSYQQIFTTPIIQANEKDWMNILQRMVLYIVLAEYGNEQNDLMHRTFEEKKLEEPQLQPYRNLLKQFVNRSLINWPQFESTFGSLIKDHPIFKTSPETYADLRSRIVEKNIRVIAQFYSRIPTKRLCSLLYLGEEEVEGYISRMVTSKTILAKMDRLDGLVVFKQLQTGDNNEVLNSWSHDIVNLLQLVEKSNHLINKEYMIQGARQ
ncbi:proteasome regulatory non-ATP-ase subunit 5 [Naegleria gruberi]|uniref:Proteasome regulatory non-ATP-ase subunit 5 n=1 Tax=Naegleria gruberi TaxID=5762 RepID=D2VBJ2_NAEGR|nr:proteasome regulatory non-ATP-ase subunit 5 [Naegleria gruberi]EFC45916.1 proteasome regulatory non-ATP-ase subunit 5 [Naegleria gruberi]|eukprot:XP_002678660.1 proteasome regulatory non-ATP-ase subunit 5 [Naegleria gruberi strain NEG-M]